MAEPMELDPSGVSVAQRRVRGRPQVPQQSAQTSLIARLCETVRISGPQVHPVSTYTGHTTDGRTVI